MSALSPTRTSRSPANASAVWGEPATTHARLDQCSSLKARAPGPDRGPPSWRCATRSRHCSSSRRAGNHPLAPDRLAYLRSRPARTNHACVGPQSCNRSVRRCGPQHAAINGRPLNAARRHPCVCLGGVQQTAVADLTHRRGRCGGRRGIPDGKDRATGTSTCCGAVDTIVHVAFRLPG